MLSLKLVRQNTTTYTYVGMLFLKPLFKTTISIARNI